MSINVGFDIDHTLAIPAVNNFEQANFFYQKGAILPLNDTETYYLYPGVLELIHLISRIKGAKISFFSKGTEDRNRRFVNALLNRACVQNENIRIFSRNDVTNRKKDLSILCGNDPIENTIIFDDKYKNAVRGQENNFLRVPYVDWQDYDKLSNKTEDYGVWPVRNLKCEICFSAPCDLEDSMVRAAKRIFIYRNENAFEAKFLNSRDQIQVEQITFDEYPDLFEELNHYYAFGEFTGDDAFHIQNVETVNRICEFVQSFKGRITKICRRVNHIAYVTGLFFYSLSFAKQHQISLSESLKINQYKNGQLNSGNERYYYYGMMKLREVSPGFELVSPYQYNLSIETHPDLVDQEAYIMAMERENLSQEIS